LAANRVDTDRTCVLSDERLHSTRGILIVVPMTSRERPWPTRIRLAADSYAVAEQPITMPSDRVARVVRSAYNTTPVVKVVHRLIDPSSG
jgi:mRNA-degrading endonuclease toxin of MazEF toxin-antitoxin module